MRRYALLWLCCSLLYSGLTAQTNGSGTLAQVELLAKEIQENNTRILENQTAYHQSYEEETKELARLENEIIIAQKTKEEQQAREQQRLADKEKEIEESPAWINRRNSAAQGWKEYTPGRCGAGGPPPICVQDHWYRVDVQLAMEEYEKYKNKVINDIKESIRKFDDNLYAVQKKALEFKLWNEFMEKRARLEKDSKKRHAENNDKRAEITRLSRLYKEQLTNETKGKIKTLHAEALFLVAQVNFIALRIDILNVKVKDLQTQEKSALQLLEQKIRQQNDQEILKEDQKQAQFNADIQKAIQQYNQNKKIPESNVATLLKEKNVLETNLEAAGSIEANKKNAWEDRLKIVIASIDEINATLDKMKNDFTERKEWLNNQIVLAMKRKADLHMGLFGKIDSASNVLKEAYAAKRDILNNTIALRKQSLINSGKSLTRKKDELNALFKNYLTSVEAERKRLLTACNEAGAICAAADVYSTVSALWSDAIACVEYMEGGNGNKPVYGCGEESEQYKSFYNTLLQGLSPEDNNALQRKTSNTKYDAILEKVHD